MTANYYRVSQITGDPNAHWGLKSAIAREKGSRLHALIAKQWEGQGKSVEVPQALLLANKEGQIVCVLVGTPDLYWVEGDTLYIVDHKTVREGTNIYAKKEWINQLTIYSLMLIYHHLHQRPPFSIKKVRMAIWGYWRYWDVESSLKVKLRLQHEPLNAKKLCKQAVNFLTKHFGEPIVPFGLGGVHALVT